MCATAGPDLDLIDSHCHLTYEPLASQVEAVLDRAAAAGVRHCITIGTDLEDSRRVVDLARRRPDVSAVVGLHPHNAGQASEPLWSGLEDLLKAGGILAVGETGLDYHYDFSVPDLQREAFVRHIELAERFNLPLVIHCREAVEDALSILAAHCHRSPWGVFHCFTGTPREAKQIIEAGWYISLAGIVTFKNADNVRESAGVIPLDRLLIETDAPFNSPEPVRKVRPNEPAHLVHTCGFLAGLFQLSSAEMARKANQTAQSLFKFQK